MKKIIKSNIKKVIKNSLKLRERICYSKKIKNITSNFKDTYIDIDSKYEDDINMYFEKFNVRINKEWHKWYMNANSIKEVKYIPEDIFYCSILPFYNRLDFKKAYCDKGLYDIWFRNIKLPNTVFKNIGGIYYDKSFNVISRENAIKLSMNKNLIIKPSIDSGGGRNIEFIDAKASDNLNKIVDKFKQDYVVQEILEQHPDLEIMNPQSVNTIRVISFLYDGKVNILSSVLRMGINGSKVDNSSAGGISCGISNDSKLKRYAYDKYGNKLHHHPQGFIFEGHKVPSYEKVINAIKDEHIKFGHFKIISWDFSINKYGEPVLIEYNLGYQEINFHQLNNGALFGDLTDRVLKDTMI